MLEREQRKGTLLHCWQECKLIQPLQRAVWRFFKKLKIELPYDLAVTLLGIFLEEIIIQNDTCVPMFIAVLFTIAWAWKQPECPTQMNGHSAFLISSQVRLMLLVQGPHFGQKLTGLSCFRFWADTEFLFHPDLQWSQHPSLKAVWFMLKQACTSVDMHGGAQNPSGFKYGGSLTQTPSIMRFIILHN